jgi:phosphonate transport system permease protein
MSLGIAWPTRSGRPPLALLAVGIVPLALALTAQQVEFSPTRLAQAALAVPAFLAQLLVMPDWSYLPELAARLLETIQITLLATSIALLFSLPLAVLAASNATPHPLVGWLLRGLLSLIRALPDLLWALLFVSALGLGALPGVLALAMVTIGLLAKLYAESIEVVKRGPVEGVRACGAGWLQVRLYAMLPEAAPDLIGTTLYMLDHNLRAATILGFVGAGGVGYDLITAIRLFQYDRLILMILAIYLLVTGLDRLSSVLRRRII